MRYLCSASAPDSFHSRVRSQTSQSSHCLIHSGTSASNAFVWRPSLRDSIGLVRVKGIRHDRQVCSFVDDSNAIPFWQSARGSQDDLRAPSGPGLCGRLIQNIRRNHLLYVPMLRLPAFVLSTRSGVLTMFDGTCCHLSSPITK